MLRKTSDEACDIRYAAGVEVDGEGEPTQELHDAAIALLARGMGIFGSGRDGLRTGRAHQSGRIWRRETRVKVGHDRGIRTVVVGEMLSRPTVKDGKRTAGQREEGRAGSGLSCSRLISSTVSRLPRLPGGEQIGRFW